MPHAPYLDPPSPDIVRAALTTHLARKLGWSDKSAAFCLAPLSNDDIACCLTVDPEATRAALYARSCRVLARDLCGPADDMAQQSEAA